MTTKTTLVASTGRGGEEHGWQVLVIDSVSVAVYGFPRSGVIIVGRSSTSDVVVDDPMLSRRHLELSAKPLTVTDLGSSNGSFVRGDRIPAHAAVPISAGEAVGLGDATIVVQHCEKMPQVGLRRLCRHAHFEERVQDECLRARVTGIGFAVVRLALTAQATWAVVAPILASIFPPPHIFASYGPHEYEGLLLGADAASARMAVLDALKYLGEVGVSCRSGVAVYPSDGRDFETLIGRAGAALRQARPAKAELPQTLSAAMQGVLTTAVRVAPTAINVMILGETGVGKEVLARRIHQLSRRSEGPFAAINCGALNVSILETELFGSEKGAFTGATSKKGLLESATGGTLFLDELGEMPPALQVKLLRVLQQNEITRVGSVDSRKIDVRVVSATNQDIDEAVESGRIRSDLYYRLNGVMITVPPLRERRAEIKPLAETFIADFVGDDPFPVLDPSTIALLERHSWPGNIRELRNVVERACALADGLRLLPEHLPSRLLARGTEACASNEPARSQPPASLAEGSPSERDRELREKILRALDEHAWNQTRAARALGIPRRTFVASISRLKIPRPRKMGTSG